MDEFINELFKKLNKNGINYAVLRNYENLPFKDISTEYFDLDLIVLLKDYKRFLNILNKISSKNKFKVAKNIKREYVKTFQIYRIEDDNFINAIQIDIHIKGQNWWGNFYLVEKEILNKRFLFKNFFVVSKFHENLIKWLDKLFWGNYVKEKYKNEILLELNKNAKELEIFLLSVFGKNLGSIIFEMIKKNQIEETLNFRAKMINKIKFYSLTRYPLLTIKSSIEFFYFELLLRLFPPGICVVFDNKNKDICFSTYNQFKNLIINSHRLIEYEGSNIFEWIIFYFVKIYPIVRKCGFVFIISNQKNNILKSKILNINKMNNDLSKEILLAYKKHNILLHSNLFIGRKYN